MNEATPPTIFRLSRGRPTTRKAENDKNAGLQDLVRPTGGGHAEATSSVGEAGHGGEYEVGSAPKPRGAKLPRKSKSRI